MLAYHIYRITEFYYCFTTDAGIEYGCSFTSYEECFKSYPEIASKIFSFDLYITNPSQKTSGIDNHIANTAIAIVGDFLMTKINAVVYVCDPADGKGAVRARKFKSWFNYYEHSPQIVQLNTDMDAGGIRLYTALPVHRKNKLRDKFIEAYLALVDLEADDK